MEVLVTKKEILKATRLKAEDWKKVEEAAGLKAGERNTYKATELDQLRKVMEAKYGKKYPWKLWKKESN